MTPASTQVCLLGPVEVAVDGRPLILSRRMERCLLAVLVLAHGQAVSAERLADLLWDGTPPDRYRAQINTHISRIRAGLRNIGAGEWVQTTHAGYLARIPAEQIDECRFREYLRRAERATGPDDREALLKSALDLWRGPALTGIGAEPLRQRLGGELDELRLTATEARLAALLDLDRHTEAGGELSRLTREHPLREGLTELYLRCLAAAGRAAEALQVYDQHRHRLAAETGRDPGAAVQETWLSILRGRPGTPTPTVDEAKPEPTRRSTLGDGTLATVPAQLPADIRGFTGRTSELAQLDRLLRTTRTGPTAVVITAIAGTAGIGKTTLAVHWAHHNRRRFPDGQLFINLRGFHPDAPPMPPNEAIRILLDSLGVPPQRIPTSLDAQAATYRSILADRKMLIVLDNARDQAQIRPLLPGATGCLVIITSRNHLDGLIATDGAHPITLNLLPADEARSLLAHRLGPQRLANEPEATTEIINRCARLPLALAIAAAHAAGQPDFPLQRLADRLRGAPGRLDTLAMDDAVTDVRAVFSCSYDTLTPQAAILFRRLGLHPGPDITARTAASLTGAPITRTRMHLIELARTHLVRRHLAGRYSQHDLLRAYATELSTTTDTPEQRRAATHRLLDHYLHTAHAAALLLDTNREPLPLARPLPGVFPERLSNRYQAQNWFAAEHRNLLAAVRHADAIGFDTYVWQLAWTLWDHLDLRGHWEEWAAIGQLALATSQRLADPAAQAHFHRMIARASIRLRRFDDAHTHLLTALDLYQQVNDKIGQGRTQSSLAMVKARLGRHTEAIDHARLALDLFVAGSHQPGLASALNNLGWYYAKLGDYRQALAHCEQGLLIYQQLGNHYGQANTLDSLGYAHYNLGNHTEAIACYRQALDLLRDYGDCYDEADTLHNLGDTYNAAGDPGAARTAWQRALSILDAQEHPDAARIRAKLAALEPPAPAFPADRAEKIVEA